MSPDPFRKAEEEFSGLKGELVAGRLTLDQFHTALKQAKLKDNLGRTWSIGAKSGKWYYLDGNSWVQDDPYGALRQVSSGTAVSPETPAGIPQSVLVTAPMSIGTPPSSAETKAPGDAFSPSLSFAHNRENVEALPFTDVTTMPPGSGPLQVPQTPALPASTPPAKEGRSLVLLVIGLGILALSCALIAVGVVLAASRGLIAR